MSRPNPLFQLFLLRWRAIYRDPGVLFWIAVLPLVISIVLGVAFRSQTESKLQVAVLPGVEADALTKALGASGAGGIEVVHMDASTAARALRSGRIALYVDRADAGTPPRFTFDPTRPEARLARTLAHGALERAAGQTELVPVEEHAVTDVGNRYIDFLIPGLIGMSMMSGGLLAIGFGVVDQRRSYLLRRMVATPMRRSHYLASFLLLRCALILLEVPVLVLFGLLVFSVPFRGSVPAFIATTLIGGLTFAAIGLLIASRAQNPQTAGGLINLVSMTLWFGSGIFFSIERFPLLAQRVLKVLPLTLLNDSMRAIMLDGASFAEIGPKLALVGAWGLAAFVAALYLFRWR